jgi:hypothetical protein
MNKAVIGVIALLSIAVVVLVTKPVPPSLIGEIFFPRVTSDKSWHESIKKDPTAHGYSGYSILADRRSNIAIETALKDIHNPDPYVWLNAALYLGRFNRKESVPYIIKALQHTGWAKPEKYVVTLQRITGQKIGNDFKKWQEWYLSTPDPIKLDWESNLRF